MIEELCDKIWEKEEFHRERRELLSLGLKISVGEVVEFSNDDLIRRLLQSAVNMAISSKPSYRKVAYEISISAIKLLEYLEASGLDKDNIVEIATSIQNRLGNFPSSSFCSEKLTEGAGNFYTSSALWFENESHRLENTVSITEVDEITFTDFQKDLWQSLETKRTLTINAPTSAGKSFVLQHFMAKKYASRDIELAVYVVPTRALIGQVVGDFYRLSEEFHLDLNITEVPAVIDVDEKNTLYVLTQERFQILLDNYHGKIDLLIVDEAQNISDGSRGVILQSVIERVRLRDGDTNILFGCPYTRNPEIFQELFQLNKDTDGIVDTSESPVLQNLIFLDTDLNSTNIVTVSSAFEAGKKEEVLKLDFPTELVKEEQSLCQIAYKIGQSTTNIIYGSEPANCENLAVILKGIILENNPDYEIDPEVLEFSKFIKQHIHKDFTLAETIKYGIAYHFGKMPAFLRKGIESLCVRGKIPFIICTSTLLQGLNLPAKNIFITNPTKGNDPDTRKPIPLSPTEFWNLSGRAGRLAKDFEGNIYLINLRSWIDDPIPKDKKQLVTPAFSSYLCDETDGLIGYMSDDKAPSGSKEKEGIESTFMKLYNDYQAGSHGEILARYEDKIGDSTKVIESELANIAEKITVPEDVAKKNPNISIYRQQDMLDYLVKRIGAKGPAYVIPPHPLQKFNEIRQQYIQLFKRMHNRFICLPGKDRSHMYYYSLALLWMKGVTYSELLQKRIDHNNKERKRGEAKPNTEARGLFEDIETALRFRYVKYTRCYLDLLEHALSLTDNQKYVASIPPIYLFLELGASSNTMMSMIGLGVSRTTASVLAEKAPRTDMDSKSIKNWLSRMELDSFDLPRALKDEMRGLVS